MVTKKDLTEYGLEDMTDYQDYIEGSIHNGQYTQAKDLIKAMSKAQKKEALTAWTNQDLRGCSPKGVAVQLTINLL